MRAPIVALALLLALSAPGRLSAQDATGWVGTRVILQFGSVLRVGNDVVDNQKLEARAGAGRGTPSAFTKSSRSTAPGSGFRPKTRESPAGCPPPRSSAMTRRSTISRTRFGPIRPNDKAYTGRGHIWRDKKEFDLALADYNEALRLDPGFGGLLEQPRPRMGRQEGVRQGHRRLLRSDPNRPEVRNGLQQPWPRVVRQKEYDKAIADSPKQSASTQVRQGLQQPRPPGAKKEYDKAIADFSEAHPHRPEATHGPTTTAASRGTTRRTTTRPSPTIPKRSASTRSTHRPTTTAASHGTTRRTTTRPSPTTSEAIRIDPKYALAHFNRAVTYFTTRQSGATDGMKRVLEIEDGKGDWSTYAVILGSLAARIGGDQGQAKEFLSSLAAKLDTAQWPYPIVRYLRGELDESGLLALAVDDDKRTEAHCYVGLDLLAKRQPDRAIEHFRWVKEHGNPSLIAYTIVLAELDRAGAGTTP